MSQEPVSLSDIALLTTARRRVRLSAVEAEGRDHATIFHFLQSIFQAPSRAEYNASLEDPFYEPRDRLLLRRHRRIFAHAHLTHRTIHFDATSIPAAGLDGLGVAVEQQGQGFGIHLLRAAENRMADDGALVGMLRTTIPRFFRRTGWALCGQPHYRCANVQALLACLLEHRLIPRRRRRLHIRPWLQWEQAALSRIYNQNVSPELNSRQLAAGNAASHGSLERTGTYWHWLLARHGFDNLYVALEGPEQLELGEIGTRVVGYAVTRGPQIVELMTAPDRPRAAAQLLGRFCGDAIEYGWHYVGLHAPHGCPLLKIFDQSGGYGPTGTPEHGEVSMMRLLKPLELLQRLSVRFDRRASEARLTRPLDLGLLVDGQKYQLELGSQGVCATSERVGRSYLRLNVADFTRLVLGQLDWDAAIAEGRLECSTALAHETGRALFPAIPLWRPPWDELPTVVY